MQNHTRPDPTRSDDTRPDDTRPDDTRPDDTRPDRACLDYRRIEAAIAYIAAHYRDAPSLDEIAAAANLSPFHFQRLFTRWAGVSPKRFSRYLSLDHARALLRHQGASCLDAAYEADLSAVETGRQTMGTAAQAALAALDRDWSSPAEIRLHLHATPFQLKVWEALLRIPTGRLASYGDVAAAIGRSGASRAVGTAIGANPVAWLIPCHRVIRQSGATGGYMWGPARKQAIIGWESAQGDMAGMAGKPDSAGGPAGARA